MGSTDARQGRSVALSGDGNTAVMGGVDDNNLVGAVWVFTRSGNTWTQQGNKLVGTGGIDLGIGINHGTSLAISNDGNTFIDGAESDNDGVGASWIFTRSGSTWTQQGSKLVGTGAIGWANQGQSVSLSSDGNIALVGGYYDNGGQGATWVFTRSGSTWTQQGNKIVGTGGSTNANANQGQGVAISADGSTAMVGGSSDNTGGVTHGAVWVFVPAACTTPTAYNVTGTGAYCAGGTGVAVGLANSETGVTYQLKNGATNIGSAVSGSTGNTITFGNQTTAATYTVVATRTAGGCTATMTGSAVVTLNTLPTAYNVTGTGSFCTGGTGVAVGLANSETGVTYQLKNGATNVGSPVNGSTGNPITFGNQTTAATYTVVATRTAGGCTATMTGSAVVTVNAAVTPSVTITANQTNPITLGSNVTFTAAPVNGGTTPTYQWKKNANNVGMNQATYADATLANNDVVKCEMTSNAACPSPTIATSNDITMEVCACDPTCNPIPTNSGTYIATTTNVIGGYTHYCDGIGNLLLSLKIPAGTTILAGSVSVQVGATAVTPFQQYCGAATASDYCFMNVAGALINRYWYINPSFAGNVNGITAAVANQLTIVSYFKNTDYTALNAAASVPNLTDIKLYYPKSSYSFGAFPSTSAIKPLLSISAYPNGASAGTSLWKLSSYQTNTIHAAEFKVGNIKNTGGLGKFQ